jgi:hypothetical protein
VRFLPRVSSLPLFTSGSNLHRNTPNHHTSHNTIITEGSMKRARFSALCAVLVAVLTVGYLSGCSDDHRSDGITDVPEVLKSMPGAGNVMTFDDMLATVAKRVPGFGGAYLGDDGSLTLVMVDASKAPAAESALRSLFDMQAVEYSSIRVRQGNYGFDQLKGWSDAVDRNILGRDGVVFTDIDERDNTLRVGISDPSIRKDVEAAYRAVGVPANALAFEAAEPVRQVATLQNTVRPIAGGLQIHWFSPAGAGFLCTLGFLARRQGVLGFVTNSHCSGTQGGVQNTQYHQSLAAGIANRIGLETADPAYFLGGICPAGKKCRYSDAAFARVPHPAGPAVATAFGRIERTAVNSLVILGTHTILGKQIPTFLGELVQKTGRTTGTSVGRVNRTCVNTSVSGSNVYMLCQATVPANVGSGDSGSPVYRVVNGGVFSVALNGILWGGSSNPTTFWLTRN